MLESYKNTSLWKTAFEKDFNNNTLNKERDIFKEVYINTRENAQNLLNEIRNDFPQLTIHDITHCDSLWHVASVIIGEDYPLNPLEGFVLGCAFLIHDAALSYKAVGGREQLRQKTEWKDFRSDYNDRTDLQEEEKDKEADFKTIRYLHAEYARIICEQPFDKNNGEKIQIISNDVFKSYLEEIIGKIAASHHWDIDKIEELGCQANVPSEIASEWEINPIKLACILRCADAGHIDAGRAPEYFLKLLDIHGVSLHHWKAQNKLAKISIDRYNEEAVLIQSSKSFSEDEFDAWNVVYDAVLVLNNELVESNNILKKKDIKEFKAKGVSGARSREGLSSYVKTKGWKPCDANIHISNVEDIVKNLGGEKLYGKNNKIEVVLRELIQNARDAIVARRTREKDFEGKINVIIEEKEGKQWLIVEDNGVGMSMRTIKGYFLNFGKSFWSSDLAKIEYPGLISSNFKSIGQFGIGFYSVFMIASEVIVETRRFDKGVNENIRLRFPNGLCLRPIVSEPEGDMSVSTIVKVCIDSKKAIWKDKKEVHSGYTGVENFEVPFRNVISRITIGLDVDVYYNELGKVREMVHENILSPNLDKRKWLIDSTYAKFHEGERYVNYINENYERLDYVYDDKGQKIGLAALNTLYQGYNSFLNVETVAGLSTFEDSYGGMGIYIGYISTSPLTAKRDGHFEYDLLDKWVKNQYERLIKKGLTDSDKMLLPYNLSRFDIDLSENMLFAFYSKKGNIKLDVKQLMSYIRKGFKILFSLSPFGIESLDANIDIDKSKSILEEDYLLFSPLMQTAFLETKIDPKKGFNIISCILKFARREGISVKQIEEKSRTYSQILGKPCDVLIIQAE